MALLALFPVKTNVGLNRAYRKVGTFAIKTQALHFKQVMYTPYIFTLKVHVVTG